MIERNIGLEILDGLREIKAMEAYLKVSQVEPLPNYRLRITFQNGIVKEYDCSPLLEKAVFNPLREASLFNRVVVGSGGYGIVWNDDIDLSEAELWLNGVEVEKPVSEVPTPKSRQIALVYRKMRIDEQGTDFAYWQSRPPIERLEALEQIREEYHLWKYGQEPRLQRVYTIVKR